MARDLLQRYIWLVDTVRRYGRISRAELDRLWCNSRFSEGGPLPRRTLYNYRQAVEDLFNVEIKCDPATYEYYLSDNGDAHSEGVTNWLLNTTATNDLLAGSREVAGKIFLENVPSAREYLAPVVEALKDNKAIRFDYHHFGRINPSRNVVVEPYFLKIFRQRWYVTGRHTASSRVKTYALDRISGLTVSADSFEPDPTFEPEEYFRHSFGIIFNEGEIKHITLRADRREADYLRALPLHHSQQESVHDGFSLFHYTMRISPDLVSELVSHGPRIAVIEPPELIEMLKAELRQTLAQYE